MKQENQAKPIKTAIIIISLIIINIAVTILFEMNNWNIDMTRNKLYRFSELTNRVLDELSEDIRIVYIGNYDTAQNNYHFQITTAFLKKYEASSPHITVSYVDPMMNPNVVESYRREGIMVQENSIVLESANRKRHFFPYDMFHVDINTGDIFTVQAERQLTTGIIFITSEMNLNAVFVTGHGETSSTSLINLFLQMGFNLGSPVDLTEGDFDEQTNIAVIASPIRDFDISETEKLNAFLARGGRVMLFLTPSAITSANLLEFLMNWGIFVYPATILDERRFIGNNPLNIYADYTDHELNQFFINARYDVVMPSSLAMQRIPITRLGIFHEELLVSANTSYAKMYFTEGADTERGDFDFPGPFNIATLITYVNPEGNEVDRNGMFFISASGDMYGDDLAGSGRFANGSYLTTMIKHLEAESIFVNIMPKSLFLSILNLPNTHAWAWKLIFMGIIPLAILASGTVVLFLRLRK